MIFWTIELETITPIFLSGADQLATELRAPSVRGALRFWFRATRGAEIEETQLRREEDALFGAPDGENGASKVIVRVLGQPQVLPSGQAASRDFLATCQTRSGTKSMPAMAYLGFGPYQYDPRSRGQLSARPAIAPRSAWKLQLLFRRPLDEPSSRHLRRTLWTWLAVGGLGSRSRRGFGSLLVREADCFQGLDPLKPIPTLDASSLAHLRGQRAEPAFTRFSPGARLFEGEPRGTADDALGALGWDYKAWREHLEGAHHTGQRRQWLGAPLNIDGRNASSLERRASPYFFHIAKRGDKRFVPQILYLPAAFFSPEIATRIKSS